MGMDYVLKFNNFKWIPSDFSTWKSDSLEALVLSFTVEDMVN